jgi:hypothetical protein
MPQIQIELTDLEYKVLEHYCMDVQDWAENATRHQIELAKDVIVECEKQRMLADPNCTCMPSDRDEICSQADLTPLDEIENQE